MVGVDKRERKTDKRERKTETERERGRLACARHLRDLRRAHAAPPADVRVKSTATPARIAATPASSNCTSPGALCAELMS
jgi:hypothetical protein